MLKDYNDLLLGHKNFISQLSKDDAQSYKNMAEQGLLAKIMVIACCDARLDPVKLTGATCGDLFVVRNIANLVPEYKESGCGETVAAMQFAVNFLQIRDIIILGHSCCGGIASLLSSDNCNNEISLVYDWMQTAKPALDKLDGFCLENKTEDKTRSCEQLSIVNSLNNCHQYPWVKSRINQGLLRVHGWYFDIMSARMFYYNEQAKKFAAMLEEV